MDVAEVFIRNVRVLASAKGLHLKDLEKAGRVSRGYLSRKRSTVPIDAAVRIADFLDVPLSDLLKDIGEEDGKTSYSEQR